MKNLFILVLAISTATACKSKKAIASSDSTETSQVLELTKTACMGTCPVFTLKVYDNGLAILDGIKNLEHIGLYNMTLDKNQLKALMSDCDDAQLFSLQDEYRERVMDLPTTTLTYIKDGKKKVITGNMGFPQGFKDVITSCMNVVESNDWKLKEAYNTK